jgi:hypothetical protein
MEDLEKSTSVVIAGAFDPWSLPEYRGGLLRRRRSCPPKAERADPERRSNS